MNVLEVSITIGITADFSLDAKLRTIHNTYISGS